MTVTLYPYETQYDGYHVQRENPSKTFNVTKAEILNLMMEPLTGTVSDQFLKSSKDTNGRNKPEFDLLGYEGLLIVKQ